MSELPFNDEVRWILGRPCFAVANIARLLHEKGIYTCKEKAEDEQAVALHFMLSQYLKHGANWREEGQKEIARIRELPKPEPA